MSMRFEMIFWGYNENTRGSTINVACDKEKEMMQACVLLRLQSDSSAFWKKFQGTFF
jgi:hypothetical protein